MREAGSGELPPSRFSELLIARLGVVPYAEALALQRSLAQARISGELEQDVLLLLEHPPVITLGRTAKAAHLTASPEFLRAKGVEIFEVERGGDVTFHGPGQLVGYPIIDLKRHRRDLHWYLRQIEEILIRALSTYGVKAERNVGLTGVWTGGRKIASIGVHARDWVTWHGFALNVTTDLSLFDLIVPCGIDGVIMTSMAREVDTRERALAKVADEIVNAAGEIFGLIPVPITAETLARSVGEAVLVRERSAHALILSVST